MSEPNWITEARKMIGTLEAPKNADNPEVVRLFKDAGHPEVIHDETPWCAAFVGAILKRSGHQGTKSLWALDYENWGQKLNNVALGAIATKKRKNDRGEVVGGHVFFVVGWDHDKVYALGGNQQDSVSILEYPRSVITAFRWPSDAPLPGQQPATLSVSNVGQAGSEA